ncbi:helix-turn-helix domain-containing protein [Cohnella lupini]|uniref:AraC family transcriptional regulator n=1 Tax=Cohnella lupini TaxID=1294267 RepID=A0A3D9I8Y7_9BACL|nr:AraC family transcriptional regulator [Cohnella lupini]RED58105.1 AraC family transcriptional regulator [Cohnella lupini]
MIDLNELAKQLNNGSLSVRGVYKARWEPGDYIGHTKAYPTENTSFVFALRGQAVFEFDGISYELSPGRVAHGAKNMTLNLKVGPHGFEYILIHYALIPSSGASAGYSMHHYALDTGENPIIVELLHRLNQTSATPGNIEAFEAKGLFYSILHEMLSSARSQSNRDSKHAIERVIDYIHSHYMNSFSLNELAGIAGMEIKPFSYHFSKYCGIFPIDYLIQQRMKHAKQLLAMSSCTIRDISTRVGYSDAHYFSRLFKIHVGCSPTLFRQTQGNYPPSI